MRLDNKAWVGNLRDIWVAILRGKNLIYGVCGWAPRHRRVGRLGARGSNRRCTRQQKSDVALTHPLIQSQKKAVVLPEKVIPTETPENDSACGGGVGRFGAAEVEGGGAGRFGATGRLAVRDAGAGAIL